MFKPKRHVFRVLLPEDKMEERLEQPEQLDNFEQLEPLELLERDAPPDAGPCE